MKTIFKKLSVIVTILAVFVMLYSCELTKPIGATSNPIGSKVGKSEAIGILAFPPFSGSGDAGVVKAAKNGGITKISTIDYTYSWYFIYQKWTCTVTGE
jgi:hypothetical protein